MLRLPDENTLQEWSDHSGAPRVLVRCAERLAVEASVGWPAWIGLAGCDSLNTHVDAICAWRPDLIVTVVDQSRHDDPLFPGSILTQMVSLDFGTFDDSAKPQPSPMPWPYSVGETAIAARSLRETSATLVGGFFRPGVMCVDYADLRALLASDVVECVVVTVRLTHKTASTTLAHVSARVVRNGFQPQAVYSAIKASPSFSMQDHDEITAAIESALPDLPTIGPAVPLIGGDALSQATQVSLLIAGKLTMSGSESQ